MATERIRKYEKAEEKMGGKPIRNPDKNPGKRNRQSSAHLPLPKILRGMRVYRRTI